MNFKLRLLCLSILDAIIVAVAVTTAYFLRFDFHIKLEYADYLLEVILSHIIFAIPSFYLAKIYRRVWQYASIGELVSIIKAATFAEVTFYFFHLLAQTKVPEFIVPRSIYLLAWVLIILGVGGSRFAWRMFRDSYMKIQPHHRRTLIFGAGKAGALIAKEIKHAPNFDLYPIAFVDDDIAKKGLEILGIPVLGGRDQIQQIVLQHKIDKIIIAIPSAPRFEIAKIIELCKKY